MSELTETEKILMGVGMALHNWSRVEGAITSILFRCMGTKTPTPAAIIWRNIVGLEPKLKIVRQMMPLHVADAHSLALWDKITKAIKNRNATRNKLAHFQIVSTEKGYLLAPSHQTHDMGRMAHADSDAGNIMDRLIEATEREVLRSHDIDVIAENFKEMAKVIDWFEQWVIECKSLPFGFDTDPPKLVSDFIAALPSDVVLDGHAQLAIRLVESQFKKISSHDLPASTSEKIRAMGLDHLKLLIKHVLETSSVEELMEKIGIS